MRDRSALAFSSDARATFNSCATRRLLWHAGAHRPLGQLQRIRNRSAPAWLLLQLGNLHLLVVNGAAAVMELGGEGPLPGEVLFYL